MTMTVTRPAPAKAQPRKPALRWYLVGRSLEHTPLEVFAVAAAPFAFLVTFAYLGGSRPAAYLAAVAITAPLAWWLTGPASTERRAARTVEARWAKACTRLGLYSFSRFGVTQYPDLTNIKIDEHRNVTADITLPPGLWFSRLTAEQSKFEAVYSRGNLRSLTIHGDDDHRHGRLTITRWVAFDRHTTDAHTYRPGAGIAVREDGGPVHFQVGPEGPNILVAGIKGSGKSSYINAIVAETLTAPWPVRRVGIDLKQVELGPWSNVFDVLALTPSEALEALRMVSADITARAAWMRRQGIRKWVPVIGVDPVVVVVDELRELVREWPGDEKGDADDRGVLLASIAALGRAVGVQLVVATQNPLAKHVGEIRQNCDLTICCRVRTETESFTALGDIGRQLRPDLITGAQRGVAWVVGDDYPYRARALWLDDADVARLARR